jgi:hypothetical protein
VDSEQRDVANREIITQYGLPARDAGLFLTSSQKKGLRRVGRTPENADAWDDVLRRFQPHLNTEKIKTPPLPPPGGEIALQTKYGFPTFKYGIYGAKADAQQAQIITVGRLVERTSQRLHHLESAIVPSKRKTTEPPKPSTATRKKPRNPTGRQTSAAAPSTSVE